MRTIERGGERGREGEGRTGKEKERVWSTGTQGIQDGKNEGGREREKKKKRGSVKARRAMEREQVGGREGQRIFDLKQG